MTAFQPDEATILRALGVLEDKLTVIINTGLASVNASLATIQQQHSATVLEQAKLNAGFADRDRVEALARRVDAINVEISNLHRQDDLSTAERTATRQSLEALSQSINSQVFSITGSTLGYTLTGMFVIAGVILTFVLNHLVK